MKGRCTLVSGGGKGGLVGYGRTYEAKDEHGARGNGMHDHAPAEDADMAHAHVQVPEEVAECEALEQACQARVTPDAQLPILPVAPRGPLLIVEYNVEAEGIDDAALQKAHYVDVPIDPGAAVKLAIDVRQKAGRQPG